MNLSPHILGCLLGTAVGDASGLPREGLTPQRAHRLYAPDVSPKLLAGLRRRDCGNEKLGSKNRMNSKLPSRDASVIEPAMLGSIVGDALGVPVEFTSRSSLREAPVTGLRGFGTHHQPAGTWSDDSSLMLCLAVSLAEAGVDYHDQAARFVSWMRNASWTPHGEVFDIGNATREARFRLDAGVDPTEAGLAGEFYSGNGSLMRILPMGLYLAFAGRDERVEIAAACSRLTHSHPRCQVPSSVADRSRKLCSRGGTS